MKVEVIGLPGVGKTTLIEKNIQTLSDAYTIIQSRNTNFQQKLVTKIFLLPLYRKLTPNKALAKRLAYRHGCRLFQKKDDDMFFYDSGFLQLLLEELVEQNFDNQDDILQLLDHVLLPDRLIYIKDDIDEIVAREVNRGKRRYDLDAKAVYDRYIRLDQVIENALLPKVQDCRIVNVHDNNDFLKAIGI